jgi:DNA-binding NtrC family response regulator
MTQRETDSIARLRTQPIASLPGSPLTRPTTLIVDDDPSIRQGLRELLQHEGLSTLEAGDGKTALDLLARGGVDLLLLDLELPRVSGFDVLQWIGDKGLDVAVVIVSGRGSIRAAVATTKLGAYDFLEKPVDGETTLRVVREVLERNARRRGNAQCVPELRSGVIGSSAAISEVLHLIARAARTDAKVLVTGESGTGKELTARAIHENSARRHGPFVAVNCAAIPENLIESELFGHERGAFTGAVARRLGKLEQSHRGTLFLDEIADMSLMTQAKVLRVLEERRLHRVGGESDVNVDFRVVAATNKDLATAVEQGDFREDLYYRLNIVRIDMPALRARRDDVPELAQFFLRSLAQAESLPERTLTPAAVAALMAYEWPGNVRELRNAMERLLVLGPAGPVQPGEVRALLRVEGEANADRASSLREARHEFERAFVQRALRAHEGRIQETADELGIDRSHLWKKMRRLGIDVP